jgi:phage tail sheath protein FI
MTLLSPGVFVQEVPSQISAITGVSTSTAAFIGICPATVPLVAKNPTFDPTADPATASGKKFVFVTHTIPTADKTPILITSWAQFTRAFGDLVGTVGVDATSAATAPDAGYQALSNAVYGFFNNGGGQCYVARVSTAADVDAVLTAFLAIPEISLVAAPGQTDAGTYTKLEAHCSAAGNRFAILDAPVQDTLTDLIGAGSPARTDLAAVYYPWVTVPDPGTLLRGISPNGALAVPPSGHIAGIYARVDTERGVFKAPANEVVRGALGVSVGLSRSDQDILNPKGVNAIRVLNGNVLVFGARTVGGDANGDLKYISVRRTLLFLRESIEQGMQFAVFEPNTPGLQAKVTRNITAFLTTVWRSGALFGNTPQEAFTVKCDTDNNPPDSRAQGQLVADIGVAIARPAEFVIFRISQSAPAK